MAHVVLQFGQCGNQLGEDLFSLAFSDNVSSKWSYSSNTCSRDSWFHHDSKNELRARSILIDSESKVVSSSNHFRKNSWMYNSKNVVTSNSGGAGNNFALGYAEIGPQLRDQASEALRKECEKCDRVRGIFSLGSCGGGTGSGVGTYLTEEFKDCYTNKCFVSVLVTPYFSGEVVTQNINMLFMLSKQSNVCDALVVFENDLIYNLVTHQHRLKSAAFLDLNKIISYNILSFLQPLKTCNSTSLDFSNVLSHLCPHPNYKILTLQSFPLLKQSKSNFDYSPSWNSVERDMIRFLKSSVYSPNTDFLNSVANNVISRGESPPNACLTKLKSVFLSADWVPPNFSFRHHHQSRPLLGQEKCLTVVNNSARCCGLLDSCISRAWKLFTNNVHVHHYYKYGFTKEDFMDAFVKSETILKNYKSLN